MELSVKRISKFRKGDVKVFEQLHRDLYHSLCLYGNKIVLEEDVVKDVVQEAFIALWSKKNDLSNGFKIKAFLYTVVRNKLLTYKRLKKTVSIEYSSVEEEAEELDLQILKEETYKLVRNAISELPERTRKVIDFKIGGHSNKEIALLLNITVNTVKTLQKAGYSKLREKLKKDIYLLLLLSELLQ